MNHFGPIPCFGILNSKIAKPQPTLIDVGYILIGYSREKRVSRFESLSVRLSLRFLVSVVPCLNLTAF